MNRIVFTIYNHMFPLLIEIFLHLFIEDYSMREIISVPIICNFKYNYDILEVS